MKRLLLAGLALALIAVGYVALVRRGSPAPEPTGAAAGLVYVDAHGHVRGSRTPLSCERYATAVGTGLCLRVENDGLPRLSAVIIDRWGREVRHTPLAGPPSRARMSASGRMAAWTVFVTGHDYLSADFSTRTSILDTQTGMAVADLETLALTKDGVRLRAPDLNYWGVSFAADDNTFYATAATGGKTYLVVGDVSGRTARVLRENVECPSLSPDGTRLVFKKATGQVGRPWRLQVLDLASMRETPLAEPESVDDQGLWLDERRVAYERAGAVWSVPSDGSGAPRLLVRGGRSPAARQAP